jgi:hypothetical protein
VGDNPCIIFTGNVAALYYFDCAAGVWFNLWGARLDLCLGAQRPLLRAWRFQWFSNA